MRASDTRASRVLGVPVRLSLALLALLALAVALPSTAAAKLSRDAQRVYDDYRADAEISPCDHTAAVYRRTLREITPAIEEETPAFRPAVEAALRERERGGGACAKADDQGSEGKGSPSGAAGGTASPPRAPATPPAKPAPAPPPADGGRRDAAGDAEPDRRPRASRGELGPRRAVGARAGRSPPRGDAAGPADR